MATTLNAIMDSLRQVRAHVVYDDLVAGGATGVTTQAGATALRGFINRFIVVGGAGYSSILPSMLTDDVSGNVVWVINSATNALNVYPALGETMNGSLNAALSVPGSNGVGVFLRKDRTPYPWAAPDWRAATIT